MGLSTSALGDVEERNITKFGDGVRKFWWMAHTPHCTFEKFFELWVTCSKVSESELWGALVSGVREF